jgi:hypothetical protein
MKLVVKDTL